jgi:hypothetical protein
MPKPTLLGHFNIFNEAFKGMFHMHSIQHMVET